MEHSGSTFTGPVEIDGARFVDCVFDKAILIYRGGPLPKISGCSFHSTAIEFRDAAAATLALLTAMARPESGLRFLVAKTFWDMLGEDVASAPGATTE